MSELALGISRRTVLKAIAGVGTLGPASLLSACLGTSSSGRHLVLATVADVPETGNFFTKQLELFRKRTNISVQLLTYPTSQYTNAIQLLFQQGKAPDVFRMGALTIAHPNAFIHGWEHKLTGYITKSFQDRFPYPFDCNTSDLCAGNDIYSTPYLSKLTLQPLLFYNTDALRKYAGRTEPPQTWGELKDIAHSITKASGASIYGFAAGGGGSTVRGLMQAQNALHATAGPRHDLLNYQTGKPGLSDQHVIDAVKLLRSMVAAGDFPPGWDTWQDAQMWSNFAAGKFAMFIGLNWHYVEIAALKPDLPFDFAPTPVPDSGRKGNDILFGPYAPYWAMGSRTKSPFLAWQLLDFFGTVEHMRAVYQLDPRNLPALPEQTYQDLLSSRAKKMVATTTGHVKRGPDPTTRNPYASLVQAAIVANAPKPTNNDIVLSAVRQGRDFESAARKFDADLNVVLDQQIQMVGNGVNRSDFAFPDWNPLKDYK